ncbi:MAG: hypothetical protein AB7T49_14820 [Oligoflexales bacterium]
MKALVIDTSTKYLALGAVSWSAGGLKIDHNATPMRCEYVTSKIGTNLTDFLSQRNAQLSDFDAVVIGRGPGSFTGIKIGIAFAEGLARGSSKKKLNLIGFSGLESLAIQSESPGVWVLKATHAEGYVAVKSPLGVQMYLVQVGGDLELKSIGDRRKADPEVLSGFPCYMIDPWPEFEEKTRSIALQHKVFDAAELCEIMVNGLANQCYRNQGNLESHKLEPFYARFSAPQEKLLGNQG